MSTLSFLWKLTSYRLWMYAANAAAWALITLAPIVPGLLTKQFFETLSGSGAAGFGIWTIIVLLLAAAFGRVLLIVCGFITDVQFRFRFAALLRRNLLVHILKEPGAKAIPCAPGEAISSFRDDVDQAEETISWSVDTLGMVLFAGVSFWILYRIDAQITLWVFLPLVVVVTLAQLSTTLLQKYRAASRKATSQVTGAISEMFSTVQSIQVAGAEDRMIERFRKLNEQRRSAVLKDKLFTQALDSIFSNTVHLGTGCILLLAGQSMQSGDFSVGDFAIFVFYLSFITQFIQNVGKFITYYKQSAVSKDRLSVLLQGAPEEKLTEHHPLYLRGELPPANSTDAPERFETLRQLQIKGLTYRYPETGRGIEGIDFDIPRAGFVVVTGRVGSGKTTLVRTLLGLLPKQGGEVRWNGQLVEDSAAFFTPPVSAYTPQLPRLYSETLQNNILLGLDKDEEQLNRAIYSAVMEADITHFPQGLDTVIGPRGVKLSGGQAQRAAAARMFVREAELLVFDDLSSALDVDTERRLWERLDEGRRETACLVVSHRKAALAKATRILVMKDGRLEAAGTLDHLLDTSEEFRKIWYREE